MNRNMKGKGNGHILPGTNIVVDLWNKHCHGQLIHFLSHIHGDHIVGLTSTWMKPIYCSQLTAEILHLHYGIKKSLLYILPIEESFLIRSPYSREEFYVTCYDANHCPGAVMFYFQGTFGNIFYTADFRYDLSMRNILKDIQGKVSCLYIDNTFCSPSCEFPSRDDCLAQIIDVIKEYPKHDIIIGMRKMGKEDLLVKIGLELDEDICVSSERLSIIQLLYNTNIFKCLSNAGQGCRIRSMPFHQVTCSYINNLNERRPSFAILPTAIFTGLPSKPFSKNAHICVIPYSDHSSYNELHEFIQFLKPSHIVPIVTSTRGPFGTNISDRSDMSSFTPYLNPSKKDDHSQEKCFKRSQDFNGVNAFELDENFGEPSSISISTPFPISESANFKLDHTQHVSLKRKRSLGLPLKKRKIAQGVHYDSDACIESGENSSDLKSDILKLNSPSYHKRIELMINLSSESLDNGANVRIEDKNIQSSKLLKDKLLEHTATTTTTTTTATTTTTGNEDVLLPTGPIDTCGSLLGRNIQLSEDNSEVHKDKCDSSNENENIQLSAMTNVKRESFSRRKNIRLSVALKPKSTCESSSKNKNFQLPIGLNYTSSETFAGNQNIKFSSVAHDERESSSEYQCDRSRLCTYRDCGSCNGHGINTFREIANDAKCSSSSHGNIIGGGSNNNNIGAVNGGGCGSGESSSNSNSNNRDIPYSRSYSLSTSHRLNALIIKQTSWKRESKFSNQSMIAVLKSIVSKGK